MILQPTQWCCKVLYQNCVWNELRSNIFTCFLFLDITLSVCKTGKIVLFFLKGLVKYRFDYFQIPLHPAEHYYLHTKPVPGLQPTTPVVRDPDGFVYFRENEGRFLAGGFQPWAKPAFVAGSMPTSMKVYSFSWQTWFLNKIHFKNLIKIILSDVFKTLIYFIRYLAKLPRIRHTEIRYPSISCDR